MYKLKKVKKVSRRNDFWIIFLCSVLFLAGVLNDNKFYEAYAILMSNLYLVYKHKDNIITLVIFGFILWSNYSILAANVFFLPSCWYTQWNNDPIILKAYNIIFLFSILLCLFFPTIKQKDFLFSSKSNPHNIYIFVGSVLFLIYILIYGFKQPEFAGERGTPSPLYEYSLIIFIHAFLYSNKAWQRYTLTIILLLFAAQNLVFGGRVTALQLIITLFFVYLKPGFKIKIFIPVAFLLLILFSAIGSARGNIMTSGGIISRGINQILETKLMLDTAYAAFFCSLTALKVDLFTDFNTHIYLLKQHIYYIFVGGNVKDANLAIYTLKYYIHTFGSVLPFFGYFYLGGYVGVVILSLYLSKLFNFTFTRIHSNFWKCMLLYLVATVPRWYLYSTSPITRGLIIFCFVYYICYIFHKVTHKAIHK